MVLIPLRNCSSRSLFLEEEHREQAVAISKKAEISKPNKSACQPLGSVYSPSSLDSVGSIASAQISYPFGVR